MSFVYSASVFRPSGTILYKIFWCWFLNWSGDNMTLETLIVTLMGWPTYSKWLLYCSCAFLCSWRGNVPLESCHFVFYKCHNWHWSFFGCWTLPYGFPSFASAIFLSKPLWFCSFLVLGIVSGFLYLSKKLYFSSKQGETSVLLWKRLVLRSSVDCDVDFAARLKGHFCFFCRTSERSRKLSFLEP